MTNQHVVGPSELVAVQFDPELKVAARVLALDPQRDVAVLWIDPSAFPAATVAKLAKSTETEPSLVEGERVMTIGSPLNQRKVMTTGIASKIEAHAIISDVNINHGNSGGPLFNSLGEVVGITTFGDFSNQGGPGISGILKIEEAIPVIELARGKMSLTEKPDPRRLPVDPTDTYPLEAIKEVVEAKKFDYDPYLFGVGDYEVVASTPLFQYRRQTEAQREAEKTKSKRTKSKDSIKNTYRPVEEFKNWAEYVGQYKPVLIIQAQPKMAESFWSAMNRGLAANYGIRTPANLHFKSDFYKMKLFCGEKEIEPIHPSKVFFLTNERTAFVRSNDATYVGLYAYPPDAVTTQCSTVRVEIFSEKHPDKAEAKVLEKKTVNRIVEDFAPYFKTKQ